MSQIINKVVAVIVFVLASIITYHYLSVRDGKMEALENRVLTIQRQMAAYDKAVLSAEEEKKKIEEEYAEKNRLLRQVIESSGLSDMALPDDVLRLLKEGSRRAADVPPACNASR